MLFRKLFFLTLRLIYFCIVCVCVCVCVCVRVCACTCACVFKSYFLNYNPNTLFPNAITIEEEFQQTVKRV